MIFKRVIIVKIIQSIHISLLSESKILLFVMNVILFDFYHNITPIIISQC
jgi:hypothetical protein